MIGYIIALLPAYLFLYLPLSSMINGPPLQVSDGQITNLNSSLIADDEPLSCPEHSFNTHILSLEPLIVYIENFLSPTESKHLLEISGDKFTPSTVTTNGETTIKKHVRFSEVALIDRDEIVRCIEHRARAFQGWRPDIHIERLRTQRYGVGGHYVHHFDWSGGGSGADRVSTFLVYVEADCEGGGTEFPRVMMPDVGKGKWCEFLECDGGEGKEERGENERKGKKMGITFKAIKGNAVFWQNLGPDGRGYEETYHAGLPVTSGTKVGLNIWSWGPAKRR